MDIGTWVAIVTGIAGFLGWMTALWVRAGRILQRIDDIVAGQAELKKASDDFERRITRLELATERRHQ